MKPRTFQTQAQPATEGDDPGAMVTDRWLTTRDAAERLHVSLRTIQLWVEGGILPAARTPGGHRRIPESAVAALAAQTGLGGVLTPTQMGKGSSGGNAASDRASPALPVFDVLLVEDNVDQRLLWERTLDALGERITLRTADSGYSGLLEIGRKKPDLLVTDLMMPGIDGFEMIRTLRGSSDFASVRILAISALTHSDIEDKGGLPDGVEVLKKPVSPSMLVSTVERSLPSLVASG